MHNITTFVIHLYSLAEIAKIVDGTLHGDGTLTVTTISTDTRKIWQPDSCLFIAISTSKNNGHHYLAQVDKQGVAAAIVSEAPTQNINYIIVADTMKALHKLATYHRMRFPIPTIAVTGSNGKTIVKEWIAYLCEDSYKIYKSPKSYNSQIGVPLSVWQMDSTYNLAVLEAGISLPNEMDNLADIIKPTIGVFSHFGDAHASNFNADSDRLNEKLKLFSNCNTIICPDNQSEVLSAIKALGKKTVTWGSSTQSDIHIVKNMAGDYTLTYQNESHNITLPHTDKASIENAFTAIAAVIVLDVKMGAVIEKVKSLPKVDIRLQQVQGINNNELLLDYYNADYQSMVIALDFLKQQNTRNYSAVILSDILQSNLPDKQLYADINSLLEDADIKEVIAIGKQVSQCQGAFSLPVTFYKTTEEFLLKYPIHELRNATILLKGAREFEFEKIAERLRIKTHQTRLEVNLTRLKHNIDVVKTTIGSTTKMVAMVKALGYGSGGYQVAKLLENNNVDYLGVAFTDEATSLREAGITMPIMVLNPDFTDLTPYTDKNIEPVIYSFESLNRVHSSNLKIHLEFDTGMHRLGFDKGDLEQLITQLQKEGAPQVASVFSHLATSDDASLDSFSQKQIADFTEISTALETKLNVPILKHLANTAGIERFEYARFDMVRLGLGLYGISATGTKNSLQPVSTFKSYVTQIRNVPAGDGIGYGQNDKADQERKIAVVALGYADGYNRQFSQGKGAFLIRNKKAKVVGNVCMDMTMCDVTNIECQAGDEVIIFGDNPKVEELAKQIGTIPYEILTNVSERVTRVFYQE